MDCASPRLLPRLQVCLHGTRGINLVKCASSMHAPSKSTASLAGKSAGTKVVASGLWPEFRRLSVKLSRHSPDATGFADSCRSLPNNPRNGWDNYTEACNNYPGACRSHTGLLASCFYRRNNPTNGLANCLEGSANCPNGPANWIGLQKNPTDRLASCPRELTNCSERLASCCNGENKPIQPQNRPMTISATELEVTTAFSPSPPPCGGEGRDEVVLGSNPLTLSLSPFGGARGNHKCSKNPTTH